MSEAGEIQKAKKQEALREKNRVFITTLAEKLGISNESEQKNVGLCYNTTCRRINYKLAANDDKPAGIELFFWTNGGKEELGGRPNRMLDGERKEQLQFQKDCLYLVIIYNFECGGIEQVERLREQRISRRFLFHRLFDRKFYEKNLPYKYRKGDETKQHVSRWFVADCIKLEDKCAELEDIEKLQIENYVDEHLEKIRGYVNALKEVAEKYIRAKADGKQEEEDNKLADSIWFVLIENKSEEYISRIAQSIAQKEYNYDKEIFNFKEFYMSLPMEERESYMYQILFEAKSESTNNQKKDSNQMNKQQQENYWIYRANSENLVMDPRDQGPSAGDMVVCFYAEVGKPIRLAMNKIVEVNPGQIAPKCIYLPLLCGTEKEDNSLRTALSEISAGWTFISKDKFEAIELEIKKCSHSHNRILFGAPGTGKSYQLKEDVKSSCLPEDQVERVTFHPEYSYFDFVGAYKPKMKNYRIAYDFVPGPFARTLKKALLNKDKAYLLIIEEINRARVAAVFGDMFQLLDRDETGASEYGINPSEELKDFLEKEGLRLEDIEKIRIPGNMYIWATMNSADQGVYPMDTAFKRRWNFEYTGIDEGEGNVKGEFAADWKALRKHVNELLQKAGINEDKQMGPFFLKKSELLDEDSFVAAVKNKVLMYLFEDAARHKRTAIFNAKREEMRYSTICEEFVSKYKNVTPAKSAEPQNASEEMKKALDALFKPVASAKVESKSGASPTSDEGESSKGE